MPEATAIPKTTVICPGCSGSLKMVPHPTRSGRLVGYCECNQDRAVLEVSAPSVERPKRRKRPTLAERPSGPDPASGMGDE